VDRLEEGPGARVRMRVALVVALLLSGVLGSSGRAVPMGVRTVVLEIRHSRFSISELKVAPGERVRFVVRNTDPIDHELIVGPMPVQLRHESGRERKHGARPGEVSVPLFTSASTSYTFEETGTIWFGCHMPGHWDYGMLGRVIVG
jgi:uncharacterized cupredoxin-like copper-binding protein